MHEIGKHIHSFKYASTGMMWAFREHRNYRIHAVMSVLAVILGVFLVLEVWEWSILILTITLGFVIETVNTAIEATTDAIDKNWREDIKIAKDVAAAAMLIYSFGAIAISLLLFIPHVIVLFY